jgi:hypothetical protein
LKISFPGIFWGLICIGIGCCLLAGTWGSYLDYNRLQEYNGRATGHITKKSFQAAADGSGNYLLDYWFLPAAGSKVSVSSVIAKQQWDILRVNDTMEIRYDQSNPNRNIPMYGGSPSLVMAFFMLVLGVVFMLFGGSRCFYSFHKRKTCK